MSSRPQLRAAIVGAGLMGFWHGAALRRLGIAVVAVADNHHERCRRLAARHGARAFDDLATLLREQAADVIHLCTPSRLHVEQIGQALHAGRHLLVEKPLATSAAETRVLLEQAESVGLMLCPVHQFPFQAGCQRLLSEMPRLGRIRHIDYWTCSAGADHGPADAKDIVAADILPHPLSLFARFLQIDLATLTWSVSQPAPGELRAHAAAGEISLGVVISMNGRPTMNLLRVIGEKGCAHNDLFHDFLVVEPGSSSRAYKVARPMALAARTLSRATFNLMRRIVQCERAYPGLRELVARFYTAVAHDSVAPISPHEIIAVAEARDRILGGRR